MGDPANPTRGERHATIAATLAGLDDRGLEVLVDSAPVRSFGIGGTTAVVDVGGTPVFVKRIALTRLERRAEHVGSTANLFALPRSVSGPPGSARGARSRRSSSPAARGSGR